MIGDTMLEVLMLGSAKANSAIKKTAPITDAATVVRRIEAGTRQIRDSISTESRVQRVVLHDIDLSH